MTDVGRGAVRLCHLQPEDHMIPAVNWHYTYSCKFNAHAIKHHISKFNFGVSAPEMEPETRFNNMPLPTGIHVTILSVPQRGHTQVFSVHGDL